MLKALKWLKYQLSTFTEVRARVMVREMALLKSYTKKFGKKAREKYNEYHRNYRMKNKAKMLAYWKSRREAAKLAVGA